MVATNSTTPKRSSPQNSLHPLSHTKGCSLPPKASTDAAAAWRDKVVRFSLFQLNKVPSTQAKRQAMPSPHKQVQLLLGEGHGRKRCTQLPTNMVVAAEEGENVATLPLLLQLQAPTRRALLQPGGRRRCCRGPGTCAAARMGLVSSSNDVAHGRKWEGSKDVGVGGNPVAANDCCSRCMQGRHTHHVVSHHCKKRNVPHSKRWSTYFS